MIAPNRDKKAKINITCKYCQKLYTIEVGMVDYFEWKSGMMFIQDSLHYLTAGERELLISKTCDSCWKKLYPNDGDMEDEED